MTLAVVTFLTNAVVEELLQELRRVHCALVSTPKPGGTLKPPGGTPKTTQDPHNPMVGPQKLSSTPESLHGTPNPPS